jgi:hypothetical protein
MDDQDVRKVLVFEVVEHLGKTFAPMLRILHTRF